MEKNDDLLVFSEAGDTPKERPSLKKEALGYLLDDKTWDVPPRIYIPTHKRKNLQTTATPSTSNQTSKNKTNKTIEKETRTQRDAARPAGAPLRLARCKL